jgi:hypothetical protein
MSGNEEKQESLHEEWQTIQCAKWNDDKKTNKDLQNTGNLGSVASKLAVTFYQENHDRNHKLRNIV